MATFIVNGQPHELSIIGKNGIDYSADFIGNTSHGMDRDEDGNYIATQEDLEWWQKVMADHQSMEESINEYVEQFGFDEVSSYLEKKGVFGYDMDLIPTRAREALEELN